MLNLWAKQYGAVYKMFVGHTPVVVVTGMDPCCACNTSVLAMLLSAADQDFAQRHLCSAS